MSRYKIHDQQGLYFLTLTVVGWIDVFSRAKYKHIILDSLRYCQKEKGLNVYAYVIMSNHIHLVASADEGHQLSDILRDFKKFTAKQIIKEVNNNTESRKEWLLYLFRFFAQGRKTRNRTHQFWQEDNHPMELYSPIMIEQKLAYIHNNPVNAEIVSNPIHYLFSSASNYHNGTGLLEVKIIEPMSNIGYIPS